jgi:hypothetical protein
MRMMKSERVVRTLADPTVIVDGTAPVFAKQMGEDWDTISEERKREWRILAYKIYEIHVQNKLAGFTQAVTIVEMVQTTPSTPKSWLRGVQEAKNALAWALENLKSDIDTHVEVPDVLPDDFSAEDEYKDLRAGDVAPEQPVGVTCGEVHEDNWTCTRPPHPEHFMHWDADMGEYAQDAELSVELEGRILATWKHGQRLDTLHPALGDLEDD